MNKFGILGPLAVGIVLTLIGTRFATLDIAAFVGFVVMVALIVYIDRKNVKLEGVMIMRRTQRGRDFIDKVAKLSPNGWRMLANVGIVLGFILMIGVSYLMITQAYAVATGSTEGGVKLLLPGPVSTPVNGPGVFVVPWWIWIIGIAFVIIPHEFSHGIMCRIDNVRIKSVGWVLLAVIPGAFVEPDEAQLKKQKKMTKLRVYAAGSFANMVMTLLVIVAFTVLIASVFTPSGVFVATVAGGAAYNASINGSIVSIDGTPVSNHNQLAATLTKYKPGDSINVGVAQTNYIVPAMRLGTNLLSLQPLAAVNDSVSQHTIKLAENDGKAYLGVVVLAEAGKFSMDINTYGLIATLLLWMFIFSFGIGMVNMLPIGPLDGGQFFGELVGSKRVLRYVTAVMVALLLFNLLGPIFLPH